MKFSVTVAAVLCATLVSFVAPVNGLADSDPLLASTDFNANGNSDFLWQDNADGKVYVADLLTHGNAPYFVEMDPDPDEQVQGTGDFDGDGHADVLLRNWANGQIRIWFLDDSGYRGSAYPYILSDSAWSIQGIGDFNGDGKADILLRNFDTGLIYIWLMDGPDIAAHGSPLTADDTAWTIRGIGDFNGDGKDDILWHNTGSGQIYMWFMDGINIAASGSPYSVDAATWKIRGVGDFNGDGKADIVLRNLDNGMVYVWIMDGLNIVSHGSPYVVDDVPGWTIIKTGDYDGDGKTDLLWRRTSDGMLYMWMMDGTALSHHQASETITAIAPRLSQGTYGSKVYGYWVDVVTDSGVAPIAEPGKAPPDTSLEESDIWFSVGGVFTLASPY